MSKRVSFSCDGNEFEYPITSFTSKKAGENYSTNNYKKSRFTLVSPPPSKSSSGGLSAEKFVKGVGAKVARALSFISLAKMTSTSSRKVCNSNYTSSSSSSSNLGRCRSYVEPLDECHRAEAVQDCIQFFNSSSSLHKSNSIC